MYISLLMDTVHNINIITVFQSDQQMRCLLWHLPAPQPSVEVSFCEQVFSQSRWDTVIIIFLLYISHNTWLNCLTRTPRWRNIPDDEGPPSPVFSKQLHSNECMLSPWGAQKRPCVMEDLHLGIVRGPRLTVRAGVSVLVYVRMRVCVCMRVFLWEKVAPLLLLRFL